MLRGDVSVKFRAAFGLIGLLLASPAFAWQGSAQAGDYRVTATLDANKLQNVSLAPQSGMVAKPMQLHAWFVDADGAILAQAPLPDASPSGTILVAQAKSPPIPASATALVVMAQPAGLTHVAAAARPALVAQIALH